MIVGRIITYDSRFNIRWYYVASKSVEIYFVKWMNFGFLIPQLTVETV